MTVDDLKEICPLAKRERLALFIDPLNAGMEEFEINTALRQAPFIASVAHESGCFRTVTENLNYSADGLLRVFSKYFNEAEAADYAHDPERIANRVYANRMGNGDEESGDGWRYRGAGLIQTTGATNQHAVADHFGIPRETIGDWLRSPQGAALSATFFWKTNGLNELADAGDFKRITRKINGGYTGLEERLAYYERAQQVIV